MRTFLFSLLTGATALLLAVGCTSTPTGSSSTKRAFLLEIQAQNVPAATYDRIANARVLSFQDILALVKSGVPGSQIKAYLQSTRAPYAFSQPQIQSLVNAGADDTLVNYLGRSKGDFLIDAQNAASQDRLLQNAKIDASFWNNPYFMDPDFDGDIPFDFGYPMIW